MVSDTAFMMVILEFPLGTGFMESSLTFRDCKKQARNRLMSSMTFSSDMTMHLMLALILKCRIAWICSPQLGRLWLYTKHKEGQGHVSTHSHCKVMYQLTSIIPSMDLTITVGGKKLMVADKFTYFGSTVSKEHHHQWRGKLQNCTYKCSVLQITCHCVEKKRHQIANQTQCALYRHPDFLALCLWDLDSLQLQHKAAEHLAHEVPQEGFPHQMAGWDSR